MRTTLKKLHLAPHNTILLDFNWPALPVQMVFCSSGFSPSLLIGFIHSGHECFSCLLIFSSPELVWEVDTILEGPSDTDQT